MRDGASLTSGRLLARNVVWNLLGQGAPLVVAIVAAPLLIHGLGVDRYGILTLAWVLLGYFSLFDFGLGRALTQQVAIRLGAGREHEIESVVWTSLTIMFGLGVVGSVLIVAIAPWLIHDLLKIPRGLQAESLTGFYVLAAGVPFVITSTGLRGLLEALQLFGMSNAIRAFLGVFTYLGPLLVLPFSHSVALVLLVLVAVRGAAWITYIIVSGRVRPALRSRLAMSRVMVGPLLRFGGWMTVSNIVSPLMVYMDRFLIGAVVSVTAVAYYGTPNDMVTKLWVIPGALAGVLFPAFATSYVSDRARTTMLFNRGITYLFLALFPVTLLIVVLSRDAMAVWLGASFAAHSFRVLQWLAVGVFVNSLAQIAFAAVQGAGRPDLTAKLNLIELPFYLLGLWLLVRSFGIEGAAAAWTLRLLIDMVVLFVMAYRRLSADPLKVRKVTATFAASLILLAAAAFPSTIGPKTVFLLVSLSAFAATAWFYILTPGERTEGRLKLAELARLGS